MRVLMVLDQDLQPTPSHRSCGTGEQDRLCQQLQPTPSHQSCGTGEQDLLRMQVRCDIDAKLEEEDEEEAILPGLSSLLPSDSVGTKARVLMAKGRKLSTIYSKVSAISGNSQASEGQV